MQQLIADLSLTKNLIYQRPKIFKTLLKKKKTNRQDYIWDYKISVDSYLEQIRNACCKVKIK